MPRNQQSERDARFRRRRDAGFRPVLSEGDSWFDYPFFRNMVDLLDDLGIWAHHRLERSGDTARQMIGTQQARRNLKTIVRHDLPLFVLFSAGGNDLADAAPRLFKNGGDSGEAKAWVNAAVETALFDGLEEQYTALIEEVGPVAPIVAHGYDYFRPSPEPVRFNLVLTISGPWIFPAMQNVGLVGDANEALRRKIAKRLVDRFNAVLDGLMQKNPLDFLYVDLRKTLDTESDWENEIHPTRRGFELVTDKFLEGLKQAVPTLIESRVRSRELAFG